MPALTVDEMRALVVKHKSIKEAAREAGVPYSTFYDRLGKGGISRPSAPADPGQPAQAGQVDASDVLRGLDSVGKALEVVKTIPAGKFMTDDQLRRDLGLGYDRWRVARGSARLSGYFLETPDKKLLWGRRETVTATQSKMKELL